MERAADDRGMPVFLGVDTHSGAHVAVALDGAGRRLGELAVTNDRMGYARPSSWALGFGDMAAVGVEGTGSYVSGHAATDQHARLLGLLAQALGAQACRGALTAT